MPGPGSGMRLSAWSSPSSAEATTRALWTSGRRTAEMRQNQPPADAGRVPASRRSAGTPPASCEGPLWAETGHGTEASAHSSGERPTSSVYWRGSISVELRLDMRLGDAYQPVNPLQHRFVLLLSILLRCYKSAKT